MAKFRSWNEKLKCFIYFENSKYFMENFEDCKVKENELDLFDWQNAEQCYVENLNISEIIYKNDIGVIEYPIEPYHDEKGYHYVKQIKGVVGVNLFKGLYVTKNDIKYYANDYDNSFFISIGNIHENKETICK